MKSMFVETFTGERFFIAFDAEEEYCYRFISWPKSFQMPDARQSGKFRSLEDCMSLIARFITATEC